MGKTSPALLGTTKFFNYLPEYGDLQESLQTGIHFALLKNC
jgi:hypothetical protein